MTDVSTHHPSLTLPSAPARGQARLSTLLKSLFRSRRTCQVDLCHASAHLLADIGASRRHDVPPRPSLGMLW